VGGGYGADSERAEGDEKAELTSRLRSDETRATDEGRK
jgi:hypothetical protein